MPSAARSTSTDPFETGRVRVKPETAAAISLLSASAVRERAHRLLAIGLDGRAAAFPRRSRPPRCGGRPGGRDHPRGLSRARRALPCPLAALRGRGPRPLGGDRQVNRVARCRRAGTRGLRPRHCQRPARCRGRAALDLSRCGQRRDGRPLRGTGARQPRHVRRRGLLVRSAPPPARRRSGAAELDQRRPGPALPGDRRQPAGRPRRPRRPAPPPRLDGGGAARSVRARR